ncbi:hypothetical protein ACFVXE_14830 [Streptomyces sp. NPDC058231]|uniref:hypothetical protein n=1 Tax=unclassified Streptomyces TaxID=2593676 RepID=UPI0036EA2BA1
MNRTEHTQAEENRYGREVAVAITGCEKDDARMVFDVLRASFATDRASVDVPRHMAGKRPTVWTVTVDASEARVVSGPVAIGEPVTVDVQGGYWAVDEVTKHLADAFAVQVVGTVSGDQEEEVRLRLESR